MVFVFALEEVIRPVSGILPQEYLLRLMNWQFGEQAQGNCKRCLFRFLISVMGWVSSIWLILEEREYKSEGKICTYYIKGIRRNTVRMPNSSEHRRLMNWIICFCGSSPTVFCRWLSSFLLVSKDYDGEALWPFAS